MTKRNRLILVIFIIIASSLVIAGYYQNLFQADVRPSPGVELSPFVATPPGITLQPLGVAQGYGQEGRLVPLPREQIAYADTRGFTLYISDLDPPGQSRCVDACATVWPPAVATANDRSFGDWSVIVRVDGTSQWAYRGKPLYTFSKDKEPGSVGGISPRGYVGDTVRGFGFKAPAAEAPMPAEWHAALLFPLEGMTLPPGVAVQEVADANGIALIDAQAMTLYINDTSGLNTCAAPSCLNRWSPFVAPRLAHALGDWVPIDRVDGIRQWSYRGKLLFTFDGDKAPGDANGDAIDGQWHAALVVRYFVPPEVGFHQTLGRGKVLATASGMTLYRRDGGALATGGGHSLRRGVPIRPGVGRNLGTTSCVGECLKAWRPLVPPPDAQPSGYWNISVRQDGIRQWVYQGFALYTFAGDVRPGDMAGNDIYDIVLNDDPNHTNDVGTPMWGTAALYWSIAWP